MDEFVKEAEMLDKFPCEHRVHFDAACIIRTVMVVTKFANAGRLEGA